MTPLACAAGSVKLDNGTQTERILIIFPIQETSRRAVFHIMLPDAISLEAPELFADSAMFRSESRRVSR